MADVTPTYVPTNGTVFNPTGWNTNVFSTTDGQSVGGELLGNIENGNFAVGQTVSPHHIKPYEGHRGEWGGSSSTLDFYEDLFGTDFAETDWVRVPGACRRMYVPWTAKVCQFQVSAFVTNLRMRQVTSDPAQDPIYDNAPEMYVCMFVDGTRKDHTRRKLPTTYYPLNGTGTANYLYGREYVLTNHFDLVHMEENLAAGWHDVALCVWVGQNIGTERIFPLYDTDNAARTDHDIRHRIRVGIRAASILALP